MERVNKILNHHCYIDNLKKNSEAEKKRVFCMHNLQHFLDVARIGYIMALERNISIEKEVIYVAALLHDIGKKFTKEYKDSNGNPTDVAHYYQHHLVSAYDAIKYLNNFSTNDMLEILALIQWHMFPYFWEKDNNKKMEKKYSGMNTVW